MRLISHDLGQNLFEMSTLKRFRDGTLTNRHILTIAYIHLLERQLKLNAIPLEIVAIMYEYHRCSDTWNKRYIPTTVVKFDKYQNKVTTLTDETISFYGNVVLEEGCYLWKIKLIDPGIQPNDQHPFIGFIEDDPRTLERYTSSYDWYLGHGYIFCGGDETTGYAGHMHRGGRRANFQAVHHQKC